MRKAPACPPMGRDAALVRRIYLHRVLRRDQLIRMGFFSSVPRANACLKRLVDRRMLRRAYVAHAGPSAQAAYLAGPAATAWLAAELDLEPAEVARFTRRPPARSFLEHSLASADLRLELESAARAAGGTVEAYLEEPLCRHEYEIVRGGKALKRVLKPDGYARVRLGNETRDLFLECDLGHVSSGQMGRSFERYRSYLSDGLFEEAYGAESFELLVVTSAGLRRVRNLLSLAPSGRPRVRAATFADVRARGFLGSVWRSSPDSAPEPLFGGAGGTP